MRPDRTHRPKRGVQRPLVGALAGLTVLGSLLAGSVHADPAADQLAKLNELSRQAEATTEAMHAAQLDLDNKLAAQRAAETKHTSDLATVDSAKTQLATFQTSVNRVAAAQYMGGRTDGLDAMLTAGSPQGLIDQLAVQRVMATEMSAQMQNFRTTNLQAAQAKIASAQS
ncbi:MAG: peptidoglycan hydrolase RipC, partial [Mycobacterium sp.]